ncbi:receptor activity-modifying protein 1-like isoform X2 [Boleophthalmus pectinirostris]|uniref:receptor activity-modifying protein 1-like isoform X2 n=1 Tax=Boleophthalmus pectinirostris TaxID=150288 RepID=UPI00242BDA74|nr:receptor activity-modifying protein 1-like isoform X2 [Boleophthalmus pectinirostris]
MVAQILPSVSACDPGLYREMIGSFCMTNFDADMSSLDRRLWCSWSDTMGIYEEVTNCTFQMALLVNCFWPNREVDRFFTDIHRVYFHDCALTGRLLRDPPASILAPFIGVPVLITLLMTALVVWRSKRTEGVL